MQTAHSVGIRNGNVRLHRPGPLHLFREYLEFQRCRRQLLALPENLRADIGVTRDEVEQATASFGAWQASRFGRRREATGGVLLTALLG